MREGSLREKKQVVLVTIGFSILLWLLLIVKQFAFLYSHDILSKILLILQWLVAFVIVYCFISSLKKLSQSITKPGHTVIIIFLLFIILAANIFGFLFLRLDGLQIGGYFPIADKYSHGNSYFISIKSDEELTKIPVDKQIFDCLIVDKNIQYYIEYRTSRLSSKGILENPIDINKYIDNKK